MQKKRKIFFRFDSTCSRFSILFQIFMPSDVTQVTKTSQNLEPACSSYIALKIPFDKRVRCHRGVWDWMCRLSMLNIKKTPSGQLEGKLKQYESSEPAASVKFWGQRAHAVAFSKYG